MKKLFFLLAAVGLIFTSCQGGLDNEENGGTPSTPKIELSQQTVDVEFEPDTYTVEVTSPYSWEAISKSSWITVVTKSGIAGTKTLKFSVERNEEEEIREGTIVIINADYNLITELYVTQKAFAPEITIEPETLNFAAKGGSQKVTITANFEYEVSEDADWITISRSETEVEITANTSYLFEERTANITISNDKYKVSKTIKVSQNAVSESDNNIIIYTSSDGKVVTPYKTICFSASIVSNTYKNGKGVIVFGAPVTSIGYEAFYNCTKLTSITIPDSVTSIGMNAFCDCPSLTSVHISDLSAWCRISFGNFSANPLFYAGKLHLNGSEVTQLTIPSDITKIRDYAFRGCSSLTSVTIPDSVTSIGHNAFRDCTSLTSVTIPNSVTSIGEYTFYDCSSLTSVTIPDSVTSIGEEAFWYCDSLTSVHISDLSAWCKIGFGSTWANPLCNGAKLYLNGSELTNMTIPSDVTKIGDYAFRGCSSLTSITIPDSVTSIGSSAFCNCPSLTSVTIPDSVTSIGSSAFNNCTSLTSITIPDSVTSIEWAAFCDCPSLTSVHISDLSAWCRISFGSLLANPLFYAGKLYLNGSEVTQLTIPSDITKIRNYAFRGCSSLTSVTIPNSVTSIGYEAFSGCSSLTSITIPDSVTSIGSYAFEHCSSLTSVTIPDSVTSIGDYAFRHCTSLEEVYCKPTTPPAGGSYMFDSNASSGRKIYVPRNSVSAYKAVTYWSEYASYIEGYDF